MTSRRAQPDGPVPARPATRRGGEGTTPARPADLARHLRTPLTLILGPLADALADTAVPLAPEQRRRVQAAHRAALRLIALIEASTGAGEPHPPSTPAPPVDIVALTLRAVRDFEAVAEGAGISVTARCAPLARAACVDRAVWERTVHLMLAAAMGNATSGRVDVSVDPDGEAARIEVRGPGFAAGESPSADPPALTAAREAVRPLGGDAEAVPGALRVRLPLPGDLPEPASSPATFAPAVGEGLPRVLLAADDADLRAYVGGLLGERWAVDAVAASDAALALAAERVPSLVVADTGGPTLDALSLVLALRADPRTRRVPIVLLATPGFEDRRGREVEADELVTKPFTARDLVSRVAAHLELARLRDEATRREQTLRMGAEAANRAKDEFIAMISHELRTPLGAILIWAQLLKGEDLDQAATARAVGMIERSTRTLAQLIDDLLDASRIIAGKLTMEPRPVDLRAVVEAALDAALPAAAAKDLRVGKHLDAVGSVTGDAGRLQQMVGNLLANAVKFTPEGGEVEVRVERSAGHARVQVRDTGIGISPDFLPFIFDRFRQADNTSTRRQKGLGLGLAIARHVVEMHGGSVEVTSPGEGQGSTFTVTLPLAGGPVDVASHPEATPAFDALAGVHVLVVDDEEDAREAMAVLLGQAGARVSSAGSAAEALDMLRQRHPDVLLSDVAMPGEDGYALVRRVRSLPAAEGGQVPAAALTAYASSEDRRRAIDSGYDEHIAKPVDPVRLVTTVAALARGGPAPQA